MGIRLLPQKLQKRVKIMSGTEGLKQLFDIDIFPEEYGGTKKVEKIIEDFHKKMQSKREAILALDDMYIDLSKQKNELWFAQGSNKCIEAGVTGSFRKLDID